MYAVVMHHAQTKGLAALGAGSGGAVAAPVVARGPGGGGGGGGGGASSGPSGKAPPVDARVGARGPTVPYPFSSGIDEDWATLGGACCPCVEAMPAQPPVSCAAQPPTHHTVIAAHSTRPHSRAHPTPAHSAAQRVAPQAFGARWEVEEARGWVVAIGMQRLCFLSSGWV